MPQARPAGVRKERVLKVGMSSGASVAVWIFFQGQLHIPHTQLSGSSHSMILIFFNTEKPGLRPFEKLSRFKHVDESEYNGDGTM